MPALDVSAPDHTSIFVGFRFVCFFCEIVQHVFFMVRFSLSLDSTRPPVLVFGCSTYRSTIVFFSRSFVLAKAVHLNTTHMFADTVRFRGTSCFSLRRCRCASGNVLAFMQTASMCSIIVVGCHVPHQRRSSKLGARARSGFATRFPNRNTSRLLGRGTVCVNWASEPCGRIETESPDPLVRTCLSDVAQFSACVVYILRCFAFLHRLLQHLRVRCGVRQTVRGCCVMRGLASCPL